jgi:outer membrane protein assembly factor BamB
MVFFGSTDGTFYALDALTGEEKWKFDTKQSISCNPVVVQNYIAGEVYIGYKVFFTSNPKNINNSSKIFALDMKTGEEFWHLETSEGGYLNNLCIVGNYIYAGFFSSSLVRDGELFCKGVISVRISDESAWFFNFYPCHDSFGSILPDPSCNGNTLCFGSPGGAVYAINIGESRNVGEKYQDYVVNGEYMWEYRVKSYSRTEVANAPVNTPPAFSGDGNVVYFGDNHGYLHAVETDTGKEILLYKPPLLIPYSDILSEFRSITSFPVLYKGKVYIFMWRIYRI